MTVIIRHLAAVALMFCTILGADPTSGGEKPTTGHQKETGHVLILNSHDYNMPWQQVVNNAIYKAFEAGSDRKIKLSAEYTGLSQNDDDVYVKKLIDLYSHKYASQNVDLIIAVDFAATDFMFAHAQELFADLPIVFINDAVDKENMRLRSNMTGLLSTMNVEGTLETAIALNPDTISIAVISGTSRMDRLLEAQARNVFRDYADRFEFIHLAGLPMATLLSEVSQLPEHTIVFYVLTLLDGAGKTFVPKEILPQISKASNAPVYGFYDSFLGSGIVGGLLSSAELEGTRAAQMALRILAGESPKAIPVVYGSHAHMFDWRQLQRWGIRESTLPHGSIVSDKVQSFWSVYKVRIISVAALLMLQGTFIVILLIQKIGRRRAEQALQASHERFLMVLDSIDATVYVADMATHEILFMNETMKNSFGGDYTGEKCWDVFRGEPGACTHCTNDQLTEEDGRPAKVCVWHDKNPITGRWYSNHDRAIEWTDGRLVRLQMATDITDIKKMEEDLRQAQKMEAIGTLAGGISHDFNNILGIIMGNAELAMDDIPPGNSAGTNLKEIKTASLRARDVVRQLLSFSRKAKKQKRPLNVVPIVKESLKLLRASIHSTIEIRSNIDDVAGAINADPTQLQQVVINLCTNAAQAMEVNGGILEVTLAEINLDDTSLAMGAPSVSRRYIRLTVRDTGSGINPDIQDRIFDPYFTTKDVGKGSGMGLAIVHGIVMNHDGEITVHSRPGKGTTIDVLLPVCKEGYGEEEANPDETPGGNERILLVDDEESIVTMTVQMLDRLGYRVESRLSSIEALEVFKTDTDRFDLVISDMIMPKMTGTELAASLKSIRPDIPVIICTGHKPLTDENKTEETDVCAYVMKPVLMQDLAKTIRQVLDSTKR